MCHPLPAARPPASVLVLARAPLRCSAAPVNPFNAAETRRRAEHCLRRSAPRPTSRLPLSTCAAPGTLCVRALCVCGRARRAPSNRPRMGSYSRSMADQAEKAANKKDGLALDADDVLAYGEQKKKVAAGPFGDHAPNHMHILYCAS